jgi:hypothetical protein
MEEEYDELLFVTNNFLSSTRGAPCSTVTVPALRGKIYISWLAWRYRANPLSSPFLSYGDLSQLLIKLHVCVCIS